MTARDSLSVCLFASGDWILENLEKVLEPPPGRAPDRIRTRLGSVAETSSLGIWYTKQTRIRASIPTISLEKVYNLENQP